MVVRPAELRRPHEGESARRKISAGCEQTVRIADTQVAKLGGVAEEVARRAPEIEKVVEVSVATLAGHTGGERGGGTARTSQVGAGIVR